MSTYFSYPFFLNYPSQNFLISNNVMFLSAFCLHLSPSPWTITMDMEKAAGLCKALNKISRRRLDCVLNRDNRKSIFNSIAEHDMQYVHDMLLRDLNNYYHFVSNGGNAAERAVGCYMGMVIGDALGAPIEFLAVNDDATLPSIVISKDGEVTYPYEISNVFKLQHGQWTDDASMGACIADSLLIHSPWNEETLCDTSSWSEAFSGRDIRSRFWNWSNNGYNNAFLHCDKHDPYRSVGLGGNIGKSLRGLNGQHFEDISDYYLSPTQDSGIGGIMRLAAVPVYYSDAPVEVAMKYAGLSSQITHPGDIATHAAEFVSFCIHKAINRSSEIITAEEFIDNIAEEYIHMLQTKSNLSSAEQLLLRLLQAHEPPASTELSWNWRSSKLYIIAAMINRGREYNGYPNNSNYYGSYCLDGLAVALHAFRATSNFNDCIAKCINYRGDADSTTAVVGQLAGAFYGIKSIPSNFLAEIKCWDDGEHLLRALMLTPWFRRQMRQFCSEEDRLPITYQHNDAVHISHTVEYPVYPQVSNTPHETVAKSILSRFSFVKWLY